MPSEQNKSIVRRYLEDVWGRGNYAALRDLVSRDVVDHNPGPGQPCGLEGQEWAARGFLGAVSNYSLTIDNLVAQNDRVVDHWTFTATHTGNMYGTAATGRKFTITGTDESRIENGKIAELWHHEDMLSLMHQLGMAPAPQLPPSFGTKRTTTTTAGGKLLPESETRERIRRALKDFIDRGDLSSAGDFITPDFVGHYSGFPPVYGLDGFRQFLSIYIEGLSNRHAEVEEILVEGDRAAVRVVYTGKNTGTMMGMPATGKSINVGGLTIFRYVGDKVAEQWQNTDDVGMMQQLGVIPQMAGAASPC